MKKYIFLDIDGVLNTKSSWTHMYHLDKDKVSILADAAKTAGTEIVLTSTWKNGFEKEYEECTPQIQKLRDMLKVYGMDVSDKTPDLRGRTRDKEIERFLYFHPADKYVVIDDDSSLFENKKNLYLIDCNVGIQDKDVKKIVGLLR